MLVFKKHSGLSDVLLVVLLLIYAPMDGITQGSEYGQVMHFRPGQAAENTEVLIEAEIVNAPEAPTKAKLFYRIHGENAFLYVDMIIDAWEISGVIPAEITKLPAVEYYLEVEFPSGIVVSYPTGAPDEMNPLTINVKPDAEMIQMGSSAIEILSPEPGARVEERDILVALTLNQNVKEINPNLLIIELNGVDITKRAFRSKEIVSLVIPRLRSGSNSISLFEFKDGTKNRLSSWGFTVKSEEDVTHAAKLPFTGSIVTKANHEDISSRQRDILNVDTKISGRSQKVKWGGKVSLTSLEDKSLQSQNRYLGFAKYGSFSLKVGDTSPRFSPFTIWGNRTRGAELNFKTGGFSLDVASGDLLKGIDGGIVDIDTIYVTDSLGDTLKSLEFPMMDSVVVDTSIKNGTFRRSMLALKPAFKTSRNSKFSLNILKAKDDMESINYGVNPKDNLVVGADWEFTTTNRRLKLKTETALSLYNSNIADGAMSQAEDYESIIVVNQYFDPLPNDEEILEDGVSSSTLASKVLKELVASSLAHETSVGLNWLKNDVKFAYKTVGRSFKSLGSQGVQTDTRGFSLSDRIRLFNNKVYLNIGYDSYGDNVNDRKPEDETLTKSTLTGGISVYTPDYMPNLSFSTRQYGRENSAGYEMVTLPDGSQDSTGNPIKDQNVSNSISLDHKLDYRQTEHSLGLAYNSSSSDDDYNAGAASDMTSISLRVGSKINDLFKTNISFSTSTQNSLNGANSVDYNKINASGRYEWLPDQLWLSASLGMNFAKGGNDEVTPQPTDPAFLDKAIKSTSIEYSRMQLSIGSDYHVSRNHEFKLNAYKVFHDDSGFTEFWDGNINKNKDAATFNDQDDFVTKFQYSFKF